MKKEIADRKRYKRMGRFNLMLKYILLLPILFLLFPVRIAMAKTIYVPRDYSTIQSAINAASSGDEIRVFAGTYYENIKLKDGITLKGQDPQTTIIDGQKGEGDVIKTDTTRIQSVSVIGFTIRNGTYSFLYGLGAGISAGVLKGVIANNIFRDNVIGIDFDIDYSSSKDVKTYVVNNLFYNNTDYLFGYGIMADDPYPVVYNNIFVGNKRGIKENYFNKTMETGYNNFYSNPSDFMDVPGVISVNPLFLDPANNDFHLQSGSPCIDTGNPASSYNDLDGTRNDMGVYGGPYARVAGIAPYTPSNPSPANGATGVSTSPILSWSGGDPDSGDTVTYDVYFDTSSNPSKVSSNQSATSYSPGNLSYSTTYYWKIIARDAFGTETTGSVWQFTTGSRPNQTPVANAGNDQVIARGNIVILDGSKSYDPDGESLSYQWSFISKPEKSVITLSNSTAQKSSFIPDLDGTYKLKLIVNDGKGQSADDIVTIISLGYTSKIIIGTNKPDYKDGEKIDLYLWVGNSDPLNSQLVDAFIGLGLPNGELLFFNSSFNLITSDLSNPKTFTPFAQSVSIPPLYVFPGGNELNYDSDGNGKNDTYLLVSFKIPDTFLSGDYIIFGALAEAGSVQSGVPKIIGDISISEFSIRK